MFSCFANDGNLIFSLMIKTEIIGFCQKINRIVKLVEQSDTLTQLQRRCGRGCCKSGFFCHSDFLSPYFSEYTNGEPLITNFRFIDPPNKQTKNKSHFGAVSQQRLILQLLTLSGVWSSHITCIEFLINNTSISYRLRKQNIFFKWRCNRLYNMFALASKQDGVI